LDSPWALSPIWALKICQIVKSTSEDSMNNMPGVKSYSIYPSKKQTNPEAQQQETSHRWKNIQGMTR